MENQDIKNHKLLSSPELFSLENRPRKGLNDELLSKYLIKDMSEWKGVNADLIITDPPFGIQFSGKNGNYHRNIENVVDIDILYSHAI